MKWKIGNTVLTVEKQSGKMNASVLADVPPTPRTPEKTDTGMTEVSPGVSYRKPYRSMSMAGIRLREYRAPEWMYASIGPAGLVEVRTTGFVKMDRAMIDSLHQYLLEIIAESEKDLKESKNV